jgi:DNA-binding response OmpR family regulator
VYGIMKRHRGRTEITSTPGTGTAVRLVFPLATALTPSGEIHAFLDRVPKRVLLVDPDDLSREEIAAILVADGHVVDDARMEDDALARLDAALARNRRYDLLLAAPLDADAHCVRAVIEAAQARWPDIQVGLLMAGGAPAFARPRVGDETLGTGADFILQRPIRPEELLALVGAG